MASEGQNFGLMYNSSNSEIFICSHGSSLCNVAPPHQRRRLAAEAAVAMEATVTQQCRLLPLSIHFSKSRRINGHVYTVQSF